MGKVMLRMRAVIIQLYPINTYDDWFFHV